MSQVREKGNGKAQGKEKWMGIREKFKPTFALCYAHALLKGRESKLQRTATIRSPFCLPEVCGGKFHLCWHLTWPPAPGQPVRLSASSFCHWSPLYSGAGLNLLQINNGNRLWAGQFDLALAPNEVYIVHFFHFLLGRTGFTGRISGGDYFRCFL